MSNPNDPPAFPGDRAFKKTITIPNNFSLPAKVRIVGSVDDLLVKDNVPWPPGTPAQPPRPYDINYEWLENNRTFTLEAVDVNGTDIRLEIDVCITCKNGDFSAQPCDNETYEPPGPGRCPCENLGC